MDKDQDKKETEDSKEANLNLEINSQNIQKENIKEENDQEEEKENEEEAKNIN